MQHEAFDFEKAFPQLAARERMRARIAEAAGDTPSLLGTTNDGAALLLIDTMKLLAALATAQSLAEIREAAGSLAAKYQPVLAGLADGSVRFPCQLKGEAEVLDEVMRRGTAVTNVIEAANG